MSTLDIDALEMRKIRVQNRKSALKTSLVYLLISLFLVLFGAVYEVFSHDVYSYCMIYAFVFPLLGGTFPYLMFGLRKMNRYPARTARNLWHCAIEALTLSSVVYGVLEIYGTTNHLLKYLWALGILLALAGAVLGFMSMRVKKEKAEITEQEQDERPEEI